MNRRRRFSRRFSLNSRHPALNDLQSTLEQSYDASSPHSIGSRLLTSTLKRQCSVDFIKELVYKDCTKSAWVMPVDMTWCHCYKTFLFFAFDKHAR
jgi:hypothetical protein